MTTSDRLITLKKFSFLKQWVHILAAALLVVSAAAIGAWAATPKNKAVFPVADMGNWRSQIKSAGPTQPTAGAAPTAANSAIGAGQPTATPNAASSSTSTQPQLVSARIMVDSGTAKATVLQAKLVYPADKLEFVSIKEGGTFGIVISTDTSQPGVIQLARCSELGSVGVAGRFEVATVTFKAVPGASGPAPVTVDLANSMLIGRSVNLLDGGATLTIDQ